MNSKKILISTVLSVMSLYALQIMIKSNNEFYSMSNSIFSLFIFCGLFYFFSKTLPIHNRRLLLISLVIGLFFSCSMVIGKNIIFYGTSKLNHIATYCSILCGIPIFWTISSLLVDLSLQERMKQKIYLNDNKFVAGIRKFDTYISCKKYFLVIWIVVFVSWIPGLVATYPGIYGYDAVVQIDQYANYAISLHHPIIHTYYVGLCIYTLGNWLGNRELGMLIYSLSQMLIFSGMLSIICTYMKKKKVGFLLRFLVLIFMCFSPTNVLFSFSTTKDVLYSGLFAIMVMIMFEITKNEGFLLRTRNVFITIAVCFLQMIFRNQGKYVFVFGVLCGLLLLKEHRKQMFAILIVSLALLQIYSFSIKKIGYRMGGNSNTIAEMMSIPCMQLSRAAYYNKKDLTNEEMGKIQSYIPMNKNYTESVAKSDPFKGSFNTALFKENPIDFIKLWIIVGVKSPLNYVDATARMTVGLWYPDMNYIDKGSRCPYWEYNNSQQNPFGKFYPVKRNTPKGLKWLSSFYEKITYDNEYQKVPVISLLFSSGILCWIGVLSIGRCIYRKKYQLLFPISFIIGLWITVFLGPVVLYRYIYPIVLTIPVLLANLLIENNESS